MSALFIPPNWFVESFLEEWEALKKRYPDLPFTIIFRVGVKQEGWGKLPPHRTLGVAIVGKSHSQPKVWVDIQETFATDGRSTSIRLNFVARISPNFRLPVFQKTSTIPFPAVTEENRRRVKDLVRDFIFVLEPLLVIEEDLDRKSDEIAEWQDDFVRGFYTGVKRYRGVLQKEGKARIQDLTARLEKLWTDDISYRFVVDVTADDREKHTWNFILWLQYREVAAGQEKVSLRLDSFFYTPTIPISQSLKLHCHSADEKFSSLFYQSVERERTFGSFYAAGYSLGTDLYIQMERIFARREAAEEVEAQDTDVTGEETRRRDFNSTAFFAGAALIIRAALQKWLGAQISNFPLMLEIEDFKTCRLTLQASHITKMAYLPFRRFSVTDVFTEQVKIRLTLRLSLSSTVRGAVWDATLYVNDGERVWSYDGLNLSLEKEEVKNVVKDALSSLGKKLFEDGFER